MPEVKVKDIVKELRDLVEKVQQPIAEETRKAAIELLADYKRRIFFEGQATSGSGIGKYSTNPMYVSIAAQKRKTGSQISNGKLRPRGKNSNKKKFKNGNARKSMYFERGYKEFRETVGRQSSKKDFFLSGELERSIQVGKNGKSIVIGFTKDEKYDLAVDLESQTGKAIFTISEPELERTFDKIDKALEERLEKLL